MAKKKAGKRKNQPKSFEAAISELAEVVNDLEDGSIGLEESLDRFEEGMGLLRYCHDVLTEAEQRIEQLTGFDADGNPVTEPLDSAATIDQRGESAGRRRQKRRRASAGTASDDESSSDDEGNDAGRTLF